MTEKLFYENSHMRTFKAKVLECIPDGEQWQIVLDRTAFFPEGGGQYADTGWLESLQETAAEAEIPENIEIRENMEIPENMETQENMEIPENTETQETMETRESMETRKSMETRENMETPEETKTGIRILDVQEYGGKIRHLANQPVPAGSLVSGHIDWQERFMKMQQHTGEHIVSGLVHERFGYNNVGFHLGSTDCTMDFDGEITKEELLEIELRANEAVAKNLDIQVTYPSREELSDLEYRSKIEIEGQVRIVTIPGCDVCACCAPHVAKTGEIGIIKLTHVQRYKGGVRVTMLCGFRALADYNRKAMSVKQISGALCAKEDEVAEAVEHLKEECGQLKAKLAEQQKAMLRYKARESDGQGAAVCLFDSGLEGDSPRLLMNLVLERGHELCAVFCGNDEGGYRYVIGSSQLDLRKMVKELNAAFSGRGGGKPEMVQGSLKGTEEGLRAWIERHCSFSDRKDSEESEEMKR